MILISETLGPTNLAGGYVIWVISQAKNPARFLRGVRVVSKLVETLACRFKTTSDQLFDVWTN